MMPIRSRSFVRTARGWYFVCSRSPHTGEGPSTLHRFAAATNRRRRASNGGNSGALVAMIAALTVTLAPRSSRAQRADTSRPAADSQSPDTSPIPDPTPDESERGTSGATSPSTGTDAEGRGPSRSRERRAVTGYSAGRPDEGSPAATALLVVGGLTILASAATLLYVILSVPLSVSTLPPPPNTPATVGVAIGGLVIGAGLMIAGNAINRSHRRAGSSSLTTPHLWAIGLPISNGAQLVAGFTF